MSFSTLKYPNILIFYNIDLDIDECSDGPCLNGGTCNDMIDAYSCTCVLGFNGTNCDNSKVYFNIQSLIFIQIQLSRINEI